ncbi:hypothetical protein AKO1_008628 [Acrasis kona]|uniref:Uncharacterized protein n=1 Tax=Acrasis kona TaxID=1008807 RepID=A0AAW2YNP8_9EUKA
MINKLIHLVTIPFIYFGAIITFSTFVILQKPVRIDVAFLILIPLCFFYMKIDRTSGLLVTCMNLSMYLFSVFCTTGGAWTFLGGLVLFVVSFAIQVLIGHYFEGDDDTELNVAEFKKTGNFGPFLLILFYHYIEVLFYFGYNKADHKIVRKFEMQRVSENKHK